VKQVALSKLKDDLSKYLRLAEREEVVITGTENQRVSWLALLPTRIGSNTSWSMTRASASE
jgi:hypothetical protein